jgi:hypothetical protein
MRYIAPGQPIPPPPPARANSYLPPTGPLQQSPPPHVRNQEPLPSTAVNDPDNPHRALLAEWRRQHGDTWMKADTLSPAVRRLVDPKDRTPAIRQRLRLLVNKPSDGFTLEAKTEVARFYGTVWRLC